ncbi:hypothetical protein BDV27DRAFT_120723 [Aspergillus caelatus]|uniref:Uncharacterized protein n=1 Tax=Aspergillus caelatus TaxID=61420 RepID=A0A5N7AI01_9EURO|nr:uncharacterized protein BDV27DRAFT_120723 [Aspergillus caelatus]KAE8369492.1 hypothetical protein BDV27DRAFT_120723 [Aspergillus caelatus]
MVSLLQWSDVRALCTGDLAHFPRLSEGMKGFISFFIFPLLLLLPGLWLELNEPM